jgi:DNA mismatch repair ATPase MutS
MRARNILESKASRYFNGKIGLGISGFTPVEENSVAFPLRVAGLSAVESFISGFYFYSVIASIYGIASLLSKQTASAILALNNPTTSNLEDVLSINAQAIATSSIYFLAFIGVVGAFAVVNRLFSLAKSKFLASLRDSELNKVPDLISEVDALITLAKFNAETTGRHWIHGLSVQPSEGTYFFAAKNFHNPAIALSKDSTSVANERIKICSASPIVIGGGNSGGKSTLGATVIAFTILHLSGLRVPASNFTLSLPDKIACRGPVHSVLGRHGRLGTELIQLRELYKELTPFTLVILDEGVGGTAEAEARKIAEYISSGLKDIGSGVVLITHDLVLALELSSKHSFKPLTPEMVDDKPTFRLIPGHAISSGAQRVAAEIGMTEKDVRIMVELKREQARMP